jgi:hypothetical protein
MRISGFVATVILTDGFSTDKTSSVGNPAYGTLLRGFFLQTAVMFCICSSPDVDNSFYGQFFGGFSLTEMTKIFSVLHICFFA